MNRDDLRVRRARLAQRVLDGAPDAAMLLEWGDLDNAPSWLSLPEPELADLQRRLGALLCAPVMRLWIDRARIDAARAAAGDAFLQAALAEADGPQLPPGVPMPAGAGEVAAWLRAAGGAVLLAALPAAGALRRVAHCLLAPWPTGIEPQAARELLARLRGDAANKEPAP